MTRSGRVIVVMVVALVTAGLVTPAMAAKPNTNNSNPAYLPADGTAAADFVTGGAGTAPSAWFWTTLKAGRSYVVQASNANAGEGDVTAAHGTAVTFSLFDGVTGAAVAGATDITAANPAYRSGASAFLLDPTGGMRMSYTPGANQEVMIQVQAAFAIGATDTAHFTISVTDVTLTCAWYFTDVNYEAYAQVQNATSQNVTFTLTWYSYVASSGGSSSPVANVTFTLPPFGSTFISAKGGSSLPPGSSGGAKITHNGPAGGIRANLTTANATGIGLTHSFNVPFF